MINEHCTPEQKEAIWAAKQDTARRFASHYNQRMAIRGHRWVSERTGHVWYEYSIIRDSTPRRYVGGQGSHA